MSSQNNISINNMTQLHNTINNADSIYVPDVQRTDGNDLEQWISLKDASDITGTNIPALRQGIKRGKYKGKKLPCHNGYKWMISLASITGSKSQTVSNSSTLIKREISSELTDTMERENPLASGRQTEASFKINRYIEMLINEKDERIIDQLRHIATLEKLLADFQDRIFNMESERAILENRLKLLPAPPEDFVEKYAEKEREVEKVKQQVDLLKEEQKRIELDKHDSEERFNELKTSQKLLQAKNLRAEEEINLVKAEIQKIQQEKEEMEAGIAREKQEIENKILREKEEAEQRALIEKEEFEARLRKEKEMSDAMLYKEISDIQARLKEEEKINQLTLAELAEARKPWWKKLLRLK